MVRSQTHTGVHLAEQRTALAATCDVPPTTLQRAATLVGRKLHIELV